MQSTTCPPSTILVELKNGIRFIVLLLLLQASEHDYAVNHVPPLDVLVDLKNGIHFMRYLAYSLVGALNSGLVDVLY